MVASWPNLNEISCFMHKTLHDDVTLAHKRNTYATFAQYNGHLLEKNVQVTDIHEIRDTECGHGINSS